MSINYLELWVGVWQLVKQWFLSAKNLHIRVDKNILERYVIDEQTIIEFNFFINFPSVQIIK